jgi:hypothetical protein
MAVNLGIHRVAKCLKVAFVKLAEAIEITRDCVLSVGFLQFFEDDAALLHELEKTCQLTFEQRLRAGREL